MEQRALKIAYWLRAIARTGTPSIAVLAFLWALVSGSEVYGGGVYGLLRNGANALPWVLLLLLAAMAWKWERAGGTAVTLFGLGLVVFFNCVSYHFFASTFIFTTLVVVLGMFFVLSAQLRTVNT